MKKFTHWIAAKLIKDHQSVKDLKVLHVTEHLKAGRVLSLTCCYLSLR